MIDGGSFKHQNKATDVDRQKRYFFTTPVSQIIVNTMANSFEQWSELQIAKYLIAPVVSSGKNSPAFSFEVKRKQWSDGFLVSPRIMYSIRSIYLWGVYADNIGNKSSS